MNMLEGNPWKLNEGNLDHQIIPQVARYPGILAPIGQYSQVPELAELPLVQTFYNSYLNKRALDMCLAHWSFSESGAKYAAKSRQQKPEQNIWFLKNQNKPVVSTRRSLQKIVEIRGCGNNQPIVPNNYQMEKLNF